MKFPRSSLHLAAMAFAAVSAAANAQSAAPYRASTGSIADRQPPEASPHRLFGTLEAVNGTQLIVRLRSGRELKVDASQAFALTRVSEPLFAGKPAIVRGDFVRGGIFRATSVQRGSADAHNWGPDR
jgi:hypothetical protein